MGLVRNNIIKLLPNGIRNRIINAKYKFFDKNKFFVYDGLITNHNHDFMKDPLFAEAFKLAIDTGTWGTKNDYLNTKNPYWRGYIVCWAAKQAIHLQGDFVECGVYKGALARMVIHYTGFENQQKKFYLMDTFEGLIEDQVTEKEKKQGINVKEYNVVYADCYETVRNTFAFCKNVEIIKGIIPDSLTQCKASEIAYLSIDMNCVAPEIAALEFFWDKVVTGGFIILDDYGFGTHLNQKLAHDKFAKDRNIEILTLPTGQGLIIKR